ncbi:MAG: GHKL domain-containing protein [Acetivibrio ethanolgignens]
MSLVERCWMITSKFSVIALLMITGICFGIFVCPYMKKKKEAVGVSIVYVVIMSVLYMIPPQIDNFSAYLLGVVAAFLVMYVQNRRNIYQKIFLAVNFFSIRWLAVAMASRLDDFITKALVFRNTIAGREWLQYGLYVGTKILDIVLCIVFIAVAIGLINKAYVYKKDEMSVKEMVMIIIPSLVCVTGYGILQYYLTIYEKDTGKSLINTYGFYGALSFLHYLISIVAILVMIVMFQNWKEMQEEQRGQELVLNQVSDMEKHIGEVEKLYQDIRSLRHDMGNHIQTLEHLVALHNTDDATGYLEHLKKEWNEVSPEIKTGSPVIDVILIEKLREAREKQICFTSDFHYPENTKLNAFDLSVILNNALNNCMENVSGENPYISISSFRKKSIFMITIKNRYQGQLKYSESDLPETTKSGKEHGFGLNNIRRVAKMYMGDISLEQVNQEVILSIMLQVE